MHSNAAGVSIPANKLNNLLAYTNSTIEDEIENCYSVDYIFNAEQRFLGLALDLIQDETVYGNGVDEPKIVVENIELPSAAFMLMGKEKDSVKFSVNGIDYVRFKDSELAEKISESENIKITIYGKFARNEFRGIVNVQCIIEDYEIECESKKQGSDFFNFEWEF